MSGASTLARSLSRESSRTAYRHAGTRSLTGILSNRQYDNTYNVFEGVLSNWLFITVSSIMVGAQILIVFVGGAAFSVVPLTGVQWAVSLVLGFLTLPLGVLIRTVPDGPFEKAISLVVLVWDKAWGGLKFWWL